MFPVRSSTGQSASTSGPQSRRLRTAIDLLALGMRDLEEQLPLPAERRVRDTTPAQQKARALRVDIEDFNLRLTRVSEQIRAMNRIGE